MINDKESKLIATSNMLNLLMKLGLDKSVISYVYTRVESEKMMISVERMAAQIEQNMYAFLTDLDDDGDRGDQKPGILAGLQKWLRIQ